jgi:hypothetical protein
MTGFFLFLSCAAQGGNALPNGGRAALLRRPNLIFEVYFCGGGIRIGNKLWT